ncbi:MAG: hypothetical protein QOE90_516 [Thermoplasmata archaeon]|nr:hypothetical protein [Thermoplasmata archaeon]
MVAAMQVVFVATGGDRGALYVGVNALGVGAALVMVAGAWRFPSPTGLAMLGGGLVAQATLRALNVALDLTRLPLWDSALVFAGWTLAAGGALAWSVAPERPRAGLGAGLFLAGAGYFAALMVTLASGRISAILALLAGTLGLLLAAPWLRAEPAPASA